MVSLWHNEGWGLLLGQEGEVEDVGDGHVPCLGVHHLRRDPSLDVIVLQVTSCEYEAGHTVSEGLSIHRRV